MQVNAAFKEAQAASEAVHCLQSSFQSLKNTVIEKVCKLFKECKIICMPNPNNF